MGAETYSPSLRTRDTYKKIRYFQQRNQNCFLLEFKNEVDRFFEIKTKNGTFLENCPRKKVTHAFMREIWLLGGLIHHHDQNWSFTSSSSSSSFFQGWTWRPYAKQKTASSHRTGKWDLTADTGITPLGGASRTCILTLTGIAELAIQAATKLPSLKTCCSITLQARLSISRHFANCKFFCIEYPLIFFQNARGAFWNLYRSAHANLKSWSNSWSLSNCDYFCPPPPPPKKPPPKK